MKYAFLLAAAGLLVAPAVHGAPAPKRQPFEGVWRNSRNTVQIETRRCGRAGLCGRVVRSSPEADDAAGQRLVGTELFRDLERGEDGLWYGTVYVPDLDREVEGTIAQAGPNQLTATGCLFAGFGCKAQTWTRVR